MRSLEEVANRIDELMTRLYQPITPPPGRGYAAPFPALYATAAERARTLFLDSLSADQRAAWEGPGFIQITGSDGMAYFLWASSSHNVLRVSASHATLLCAVLDPTATCPTYDHFLAQRLCIEANAKHFVSVAYADTMTLDNAAARFTSLPVREAANHLLGRCLGLHH